MQFTVRNHKDGTTRTVELNYPIFIKTYAGKKSICYLKSKVVVVDPSINSIQLIDSQAYPKLDWMFSIDAMVSDREEFVDALKAVNDKLDDIVNYLGNLALEEEELKEYAKEQADDIRQQNHENI